MCTPPEPYGCPRDHHCRHMPHRTCHGAPPQRSHQSDHAPRAQVVVVGDAPVVCGGRQEKGKHPYPVATPPPWQPRCASSSSLAPNCEAPVKLLRTCEAAAHQAVHDDVQASLAPRLPGSLAAARGRGALPNQVPLRVLCTREPSKGEAGTGTCPAGFKVDRSAASETVQARPGRGPQWQRALQHLRAQNHPPTHPPTPQQVPAERLKRAPIEAQRVQPASTCAGSGAPAPTHPAACRAPAGRQTRARARGRGTAGPATPRALHGCKQHGWKQHGRKRTRRQARGRGCSFGTSSQGPVGPVWKVGEHGLVDAAPCTNRPRLACD